MRSSVATRYQLGLVFQAGTVIEPPRASSPQGTCESAMKAAFSASTSAAKMRGTSQRRERDSHPVEGGWAERELRAVDS